MTSDEWRKICRKAREDSKQSFLEYDENGALVLTKLADELLKIGRIKYGVDLKMDTSKYVSGSNLRADDLGEDYKGVFVMGKAGEQDFEGDVKVVVEGMLEGVKSQLVLNQTNLRRIQEKHGFESDDWDGKKVTLVTEYTSFNGKDVLAIRVKK